MLFYNILYHSGNNSIYHNLRSIFIILNGVCMWVILIYQIRIVMDEKPKFNIIFIAGKFIYCFLGKSYVIGSGQRPTIKRRMVVIKFWKLILLLCIKLV